MGNKGCGVLAEGAHVAAARFLSPPTSVHALGSRMPVRSRILGDILSTARDRYYLHPDKVVCAFLQHELGALETSSGNSLQSHFVLLHFVCVCWFFFFSPSFANQVSLESLDPHST